MIRETKPHPLLTGLLSWTKRIKISLLLLIITILVAACSQPTTSENMIQEQVSPDDLHPGQMNPATSQIKENETGKTGSNLEVTPILAWKAAVGEGLAAPARLAGDQVVVASHKGIFAFDLESGEERWRVMPEGGNWSKSLAVGDGRVFAGVPGGLVALDTADGRELWFASTEGEVLWAPLVDGTVFAATAFVGPGVDPDPGGQAWIYALDPESGRVIWSAETDAYTLTTPATGDGTLFVGGSRVDEADVEEGGHMRIHAFNKTDGSLLWTVDRNDGFLKSLASDGQRLYYLAYTDMVYALDTASGEELWRYPTENWSPGLGERNGQLYFGSDNAFVHAVNGHDGQATWRTPLEGTFNSPRGRPAVDQDSIYFQGNDNRLYALDRQSGEIRWSTEPQPRSRTAVAVTGGLLLLSGQDGILYAYR